MLAATRLPAGLRDSRPLPPCFRMEAIRCSKNLDFFLKNSTPGQDNHYPWSQKSAGQPLKTCSRQGLELKPSFDVLSAVVAGLDRLMKPPWIIRPFTLTNDGSISPVQCSQAAHATSAPPSRAVAPSEASTVLPKAEAAGSRIIATMEGARTARRSTRVTEEPWASKFPTTSECPARGSLSF
ncbi:MAG: hypothetical protein JWM36_3383 [Hyphomicrobiales bacterium]|nr:hypothetical protein [Hyphomicrobiales bacterium]